MLARDREPRKAVHLRLDVRETAPREQSEDSLKTMRARRLGGALSERSWFGSCPEAGPYAVFAASGPL